MRVILSKKFLTFILEKPQIFSNHGTGIMSSDGEAEQEASMLKKLTVGAKETLLTCIFRSQTLFASIQLCRKVNISASWPTRWLSAMPTRCTCTVYSYVFILSIFDLIVDIICICYSSTVFSVHICFYIILIRFNCWYYMFFFCLNF